MYFGDYEPLKKSIHIEFNEKEGLEIHDLLNYYRILRKQTWREFVLEALRDFVAEENQPVAVAITEYMKIMPKGMGRPRTRKVSASEKQRKSNVIKRRWEENKNKGLVLNQVTDDTTN